MVGAVDLFVIASERSERGNPSLRLVCVDCRAPAAPSLAMTEWK
jgi:hypothetical protein